MNARGAEREYETTLEERILWVEAEMEAVLADRPREFALYQMLRYHLGWLDGEFDLTHACDRRRFGGKKLRGILCLVSCEAAGGDPRCAVPGAAAVEFVHNFSLVHDDVEDQDRERRHRPTVWARWGVAHAVNAGSNMQALVNQAGLRLVGAGVPAGRVVEVLECLTLAMLAMTEGQFLDIQLQDAWDTSIDAYLRMSAGKTAALMQASTQIGALVATRRPARVEALAHFGRAVGMAFQARDDYLGIWGQPDATGKPVASDILKGKRSLPIVYGLAHGDPVGVRQALEARDVAAVTTQLQRAGAREFVEATVGRFTSEAVEALEGAGLAEAPRAILRSIALQALGRET
jgi:geranylgeranyl diphosphate synthase type I